MAIASSPELISRPFTSNGSFNFVFLIEWITIGILTVWFLFYFNRVIATIISYAIRFYSWHKLGVYVDIEALQVSLLAGRIFFKRVHYHGDNETIHIQGGYITWRYWLRKAKKPEIFQHQSHGGSDATSTKASKVTLDSDPEGSGRTAARTQLPCRIEIKVSGVEAFIYNRGPGYDFILENIEKHKEHTSKTEANRAFEANGNPTTRSRANTDNTKTSANTTVRSTQDEKKGGLFAASSDSGSDQKPTTTTRTQPTTPPSFLHLLPISVECNKAAAVLGNENTPSIITAKIDGAVGEFDAGAAGEFDLFKIMMSFDVRKPFIQMKPNMDFKRPQLAEASILKQTANPTGQIDKPHSRFSRRGIYGPLRLNFGWTRYIGLSKKASASLESVVNLAQLSTKDEKLPDATREQLPGQTRWLGLTRYLDDEQHDDRDEWEDVEYAKSSTIAEIDSVTFKMFWDIPGPRPADGSDAKSVPPFVRDINGSEPPDYGMEIIVYGGKVTYGPWADRHRLVLQQIFFPAGFVDTHPTARVKPGAVRINSSFSLLLRIEGDTILRVPFREPSRDWRWKGRADAVTGKGNRNQDTGKPHPRKRSSKHSQPHTSAQSTDARPYAWFDIKVLPDSTISYNMDVYPYPDGYRNELSLDVSSLEMYSSLNHALLWRSQGVSLKGHLPYTLVWNGLREWVFDIGIRNLDLFLLRDHTFLLVDLIEDWTTGPPPAFFTFVPYMYKLNTHLDDLRMYLNVNDANIVDNSDDLDDNDFVILYSRSIDALLTIPLDRFRPAESEIRFDVDANDLGFELSMPQKNTLNALLENKNLAQLPNVILKGTYGMYTDVRPGLTDTLRMEIIGNSLRCAAYGFFARHLAKIKDNYFGDTIHFRTNEEYQELLTESGVDPHSIVQNSSKSNDLDVILDIVANDTIIFLPTGLYSCDEFIYMRIECADVDLRVNNYYLELAIDSSPIQLGHNSEVRSHLEFEAGRSPPEIVLDGANVFGHRLFGLPPAEPAYVSNWDVDAGDILGDMTCAFLSKFVSAAQALALTITDEENGLPLPDVDPIYDMTVVRFQCSLIRLWLRVADVAFLANISNVAGTFDDRNTANFSQQLDLSVPDIYVACTEIEAITKQRGYSTRPLKDAHAFFQSSVSLQMLQKAPNFEENRQAQQDHIAKHDVKGLRSQFLLPEAARSSATETTSVCLPKLPAPLHGSAATELWLLEHQHDFSKADLTGNRTPVSASHPPSEEDFGKPFASGSVFSKPCLPMDAIEIDLQDVPIIPRRRYGGPRTPRAAEDAVFNGNLGDEAVHTSLIIQTQPGVVTMCKPRAVLAVADILGSVVAKDPSSVFDQYQMAAVQEVIALLTRKRGKKTILDVSLKVPFVHLRIINPFSTGDTVVDQVVGDEYNFTCEEVSTMVRVKNTPDQKRDDGFKAVHVTARSISLSALKRIRGKLNEPVAFKTSLDDLLLWVADSDRTSVRATFRILEVFFSGQDVNYLASLVHRTTLLADQLQAPFASLNQKNDQRRRYLVYLLTNKSAEVADPAFLTRPSYLIRSAKDHLRNSDSWKLIARLRWVMMSLSESESDDLRQHCLEDALNLPDDAEMSILATLDNWRSWDALHVKDSIAMRLLFGSGVGAAKLQDRSSIPVTVVIQAAAISVKIDHGRKQNELALDGMAVALTITPPPPPSAMQIFHEYQEVRMIAVQANTTRATLSLKWEVCELVDNIMMLFQKEQPGEQFQALISSTSSQPQVSQSEDGQNREEFHVVFAADSADINLETINLLQKFASSGLKISATGQQGLHDGRAFSINVIAAAREASMAMSRNAQAIWRSGIIKPALFGSFESVPEDEQLQSSVQIAGDCDELHFDLKEDVLGVLETVNLVIDEEARYVQNLLQKYDMSKSVDDDQTNAPDGTAFNFKMNLVLFLRQYYVRLSLHPDLHYLTEGRVARMTINPATGEGDIYKAAFDLKSQSHHILTGSVDKPDTTSTLHMPPINGHLRVSILQQEVNVSGLVTMERIKFEGASVYGIVAALATPAATSAFESIQGDVETITTTVQEIFPPTAKSPPPKPVASNARSITFDAAFVLAGFTLSASAPSQTHGNKPARIFFTLGATRLHAANRSPKTEHILPFPEFSFVIGDMDLDIRRGDMKCGSANLSVKLYCTMDHVDDGFFKQKLQLSATGPVVTVDAATAPTIVEIVAHFQDLLKGLDLSKENKYFRRLRHPEEMKTFRRMSVPVHEVDAPPSAARSKFSSSLTFDIRGIVVTYEVGQTIEERQTALTQDLVFSLASINLLASSENKARLRIDELQLQLVGSGQSKTTRSANSALLPELIFNVSHESKEDGRHLAFRAAGKALDLRLEPNIVKPIDGLKRSLEVTIDETTRAVKLLRSVPSAGEAPKSISFGKKRISYVSVQTNFAGAVITLQGSKDTSLDGRTRAHSNRGQAHEGRFGQFKNDNATTSATLRAPGIALRLRFEDYRDSESSLSVEMRVDGSNNTLSPSVVPLILQIFQNVKETMQESDMEPKPVPTAVSTEQQPANAGAQLLAGGDALIQADPHTVLGRTRLNFGLRICKQEFSMSCQPIAKVAAKAKLEDIYIAVNTVESSENGNFFAVSVAFTGLQLSLQHVYSREATFVFDISSIILSMMNSKHISGTTGISAILRVNPTKAQLNVKQLQDMLLFREIWFPPEIRHSAAAYQASVSVDPQDYFVNRYRQIAASTSFPWNATVAVADLAVEVDLGQAIGKLSTSIGNLWASSKKTTQSKQTLCFGVEKICIDSSGRTSGFVQLHNVKVRTSIAWPSEGSGLKTPLVQGSVGFQDLRLKAAFDYQTFAIAHITNFEFIMYNVRDTEQRSGDRLVAILDGDKINVYCVAASAALAVSLVQALDRLVQEKKASYVQSLKDIETILRRKASARAPSVVSEKSGEIKTEETAESGRLPISLQTDVVVTLGTFNVGAFPRTIIDNQVLKLEAVNVQARFAVALENEKVHSGLGLSLGKVSAALASAPQQTMPSALADIGVEQVVSNAAAARGGVILRVPRVVAAMQTWQASDGKAIEYTFRSTFEGKIDVGWNYSRISFIRSMWETHCRTLASRLGRPLPESALKITAPAQVPELSKTEGEGGGKGAAETNGEQRKITAVVNLPQSKYSYVALEPPVIDTPQLRDMGEATPPLEWMGLHRDRLPNLTHQVVIVTLLEIAKEVEDAYSRTLGSAK